MTKCDACGQPLPVEQVRGLSDTELNVLSAWWLLHSTRAVARFFGRSEQTIKNQLYDARRRNGIHTTSRLAQVFMGELRTMEQLMRSHNLDREKAS